MPKLSELCDVKMGYTLRGRLEADPEGEYRFLQPRAISSDLKIKEEELLRASLVGKKVDSLLHNKDIVFASRGQTLGAIYLDHIPPNTIATSYFTIIRPKTDELDSQYLSWYLNNRLDAYFRKNRVGTAIQQISVNVLRECPIEVLDIDQQRKLLELEHLIQKELELLSRLGKCKVNLIKAVQHQIFNG